jgi:hypothetical protein
MNLRVYQSFWAMDKLPFRGSEEWSLGQKIDMVAKGGFDGLEVAWMPTLPIRDEAIRQAQAAGLECTVICFPTTVDDFKIAAERFADSGVRHINIQPNVRPLTVLEGIPYILGWLEIAREADLTVYFETHRDRMTTSLRYTLQLIEAIPAMQLVADLSHYLVGEEFAWPVSDENHELIRKVLARSSSFHGRVASREQVQIPISFDYHRQWLDLFLGWWAEGFRLWRERSLPDDELVFVTELGPPMWYAITGADGAELSDRWQEALMLQQHVRAIWHHLEAGAPSPHAEPVS